MTVLLVFLSLMGVLFLGILLVFRKLVFSLASFFVAYWIDKAHGRRPLG